MHFLRDGKIIASGESQSVFTKANIEETFCCRVNIYQDPCNGCPFIIPEKMVNSRQTTVHSLAYINT
jgi:iron complex transport system ATP-binding protein